MLLIKRFSSLLALVVLLDFSHPSEPYKLSDRQYIQCGCSQCNRKDSSPKKPPITAYSHSYSPLHERFVFFGYADFLYWYAKETNLCYATKLRAHSTLGLSGTPILMAFPIKYEETGTRWSPGYRAAVGWISACDAWNLSFSWTHFENGGTYCASTEGVTDNLAFHHPEDELLLDPWVEIVAFDSPILGGIPPLFDQITAKWRLNFNQIDFQIGKQYWISPYFTLKPYVGLRGVSTQTTFTVSALRGPISDPHLPMIIDLTSSATDRFKTHQKGVGLLGGIEPTWHFYSLFSLFGNLDTSLIWGKFHQIKTFKYTAMASSIGGIGPQEQSISPPISFIKTFKMDPLIDLKVGICWEKTWCSGRYMTSLSAGWEQHVWFQYGSYWKNETKETGQSNGGISSSWPATLLNVPTNLTMGGVTIRGKFDF